MQREWELAAREVSSLVDFCRRAFQFNAGLLLEWRPTQTQEASEVRRISGDAQDQNHITKPFVTIDIAIYIETIYKNTSKSNNRLHAASLDEMPYAVNAMLYANESVLFCARKHLWAVLSSSNKLQAGID